MADDTALTGHVTVRFPEDLAAAAKHLAAQDGMDASAWIRRAVDRELAARPGEAAGERERLGRLVRDTWVRWARGQRPVKPSWLLEWDDYCLDPGQRQVDILIGEAVAAAERERLAGLVEVRAHELAREAEFALNAGQPGAALSRARADGMAQAAELIKTLGAGQ